MIPISAPTSLLLFTIFITQRQNVNGYSILNYNCHTEDGKYRADGCSYMKTSGTIDPATVRVGCCVNSNSTSIWLSCAVLGNLCLNRNSYFVRVDVSHLASTTTESPYGRATTTTTSSPWYRQTTTPYRWYRRTTTPYRWYRRTTTPYRWYRTTTSYYRTYRTATSRPTSSLSVYNTLKIVGGVLAVLSIIFGIAGYCCRKKRQQAIDEDLYNNQTFHYTPPGAVPVPSAPGTTPPNNRRPDNEPTSNSEDRQYQTQPLRDANEVPSYEDATRNDNLPDGYVPFHVLQQRSKESSSREDLSSGTTAHNDQQSPPSTSGYNEPVPEVAPPSYDDATATSPVGGDGRGPRTAHV